MKKIVLLLAIIVITLSGCSQNIDDDIDSDKIVDDVVSDDIKDDIEDDIEVDDHDYTELEIALNNFVEATNYTMTLSMLNIPAGGIGGFPTNITGTLKYDGAKAKISLLDETRYILYEENMVIELYQVGNRYLPRKLEEMTFDDNPFVSTDQIYDFKTSDFTYEDGKYIYGGMIEELNDTKLSIQDGKLTNMVYNISMFGISIGVNIQISNYNETILDFPEYTTPSLYFSLVEQLDSVYTVNIRDYDFLIQSNTHNVLCYDDGECLYNDFDEQYTFFIDSDTVRTYPELELVVLTLEEFDSIYDFKMTDEYYQAFKELFNLVYK